MDQAGHSNLTSVPVLHYQSNKPYVRIIEQPAQRSLRFRYECEIEGRSAGSIVGSNNTAENRTHPTIQVMNYQGPYAVVVSCVTKDVPYRPHPHNLVGREGCKRGVCTLLVNNADMTCSFTSLGIQCVKKKDIEKSLKVRETHKLDPFGTGFNHPGSIDLNVLRLCFQVFIRGNDNQFSVALPPVVSDPIYDKKAMSDLTIMKLSHHAAPVSGGTEVILLCDRVVKDDIQIWFYEENDLGPGIKWEAQAEFQPSDVHKQVAISFRTPRYMDENVQQPVNVFVELRKPSENKRGEPRPFQFMPMPRDPEGLSRIARKRLKTEEPDFYGRYFAENLLTSGSVMQELHNPIGVPRTLKQPVRHKVKAEPHLVSGATCNDDHFTRPSTSHTMADYQNIPVPVTGPSTSPHLTPAHSPAITSSPNPHDQNSMTPPLTNMPSPVMQQMLQQSEPCDSPCDLMQHAANGVGNNAVDTISEKFDSLGLTQNLSASLFDSAPNITDDPLQEAAAAAAHQDQNMPSEEGLNCLSQFHDLVELSKLGHGTGMAQN